MKIHNDAGRAVDPGTGSLAPFSGHVGSPSTPFEATLLMDTLQIHIELEGAALSLFLSYTTDRSQQVEIGGECSRERYP